MKRFYSDERFPNVINSQKNNTNLMSEGISVQRIPYQAVQSSVYK